MNSAFELDREKCICCSCYVDTCPMGDVTTDDERYPVFQGVFCIYCHTYEITCPQQAITIHD